MQQRFKPLLGCSAVCLLVSVLSACQPHSDPKQEQSTASELTVASSGVIPALQANTVALKLAQARVCDESGCTDYDFQTVQSNQKWIDDYFLARIKKSNPLAFETPTAAQKSVASSDVSTQQLNQASVMVRYIGQNDRLASFEMANFIYNAGAAHGMYHNEYVNFDLTRKQRIALQDLIVPGAEAKILDALFAANSMWLDDHAIKRDKLQLSDNFYYGAQGIVFVYPLYELASYAEGMTELLLPYHAVNKLIKAQYLPNLPSYK